jgi:hypothetical protein
MKRLAALAALALALFGSLPAADAAQVVLCSSARAQANSSAGQINIPNLTQTYQADNQGCVIANGVGDISIFRAAGYSEPGKHRTQIYVTGVATGTTSYLVATLPPGTYLEQLIYTNTTANAAGNVAFGTTAGGADIMAAVACGANCLSRTPDALTLKTVFSTTAPQQIFMSSSAWGNANLTVTVVYGFF